MSRSFKKTKIIGHTLAESEKSDKQKANRKFRRIIKLKMKRNSEVLPIVREISNVWLFHKDGKSYYNDLPKKELRK